MNKNLEVGKKGEENGGAGIIYYLLLELGINYEKPSNKTHLSVLLYLLLPFI